MIVTFVQLIIFPGYIFDTEFFKLNGFYNEDQFSFQVVGLNNYRSHLLTYSISDNTVNLECGRSMIALSFVAIS